MYKGQGHKVVDLNLISLCSKPGMFIPNMDSASCVDKNLLGKVKFWGHTNMETDRQKANRQTYRKNGKTDTRTDLNIMFRSFEQRVGNVRIL